MSLNNFRAPPSAFGRTRSKYAASQSWSTVARRAGSKSKSCSTSMRSAGDGAVNQRLESVKLVEMFVSPQSALDGGGGEEDGLIAHARPHVCGRGQRRDGSAGGLSDGDVVSTGDERLHGGRADVL